MKKKYIRPTVALIPLDSPTMLAASGIGEGNNSDGGCAKRNTGFFEDDDEEDEGPGEWEYRVHLIQTDRRPLGVLQVTPKERTNLRITWSAGFQPA